MTSHTVEDRPFGSHERCESCGNPADVELRDGSLWCFGCDASARSQGYDNEPIVAMRDDL